MLKTERLPITIEGIAEKFNLKPSEVRHWPCLSNIRAIFTEYNMGYLSREKLKDRLSDMVDTFKKDENVKCYFSEELDAFISSLSVT